MNIKDLKNIEFENKVFYIFLAVHLIVWTLLPLIRTVLPTDALEGIYWGSLFDLGTPKHPPLMGWIAYMVYTPFKSDFLIYFISQAFILFGFIYIYRLAKCFLDHRKAMLSVIILEGCWVYSYITGYYGFNPDVILLFTLPAIAHYFYHCLKENKKSDWIKLGLITGISFLNKYQTGMLIIPMFIWTVMFKKEVFKNKYFYLSVLIAFLIFLPHLLWLVRYNFFPLFYFESELTATSWINHITAPLIFLLMQFALIAGTLSIFAIIKFREKSPLKFYKTHSPKEFWFLILLGLGPLVIHLLMGFIDGGTMRPRWGFEFWFLTGIMLFYFIPCKVERKEFILAVKYAFAVMLIIFISLGTLLAVEKNYRSRYPVDVVFNDFQNIWSKNYQTPLKYFGGYIEWTLPLTIYGKKHTECILDTFGYKNPWIDENELKKSGILIVDRNVKNVIKETKNSCPYLPDNFKIKPVEYKFTVYNALKLPREYSIYYFIVPPM